MISSEQNRKRKGKGRRSLAQRPRSLAAFVAGILTISALGIVWTVVLHNLPTQIEVPVVDQSVPADPSAAPSSSAADPPPSASFSPLQSPSPVEDHPRPTPTPPGRIPLESARNPTLPPPPPIAQEPRDHQELARNCSAALARLCEDVPPGGGRRKKCFQDNVGNLSPACQVKLQEQAFRMDETIRTFRAACATDVRRLCPHLPLGDGRILECLEDRSKELSEGCYVALEENLPLLR